MYQLFLSFAHSREDTVFRSSGFTSYFDVHGLNQLKLRPTPGPFFGRHVNSEQGLLSQTNRTAPFLIHFH